MAGIISTAQAAPKLDANGNPVVSAAADPNAQPATAASTSTSAPTATAASTNPSAATTPSSTGIIGSAMAPTSTAAPTAGVATPLGQNSATGSGAAQLGNTTQWNVTTPQTVAGQVQSITAGDSPLMQMARTSANEQSAARGLSNSSMAVTASDQAAYAAALPIAQADAATNAKSASYNADESNQFGVQNMAAQNTFAGQSLAAATQTHATDTSAATAIANANLDAATKLQLQNIDSATKVQLATLQNANSQLLQTNQSASSAFSAYMNTVANISSSTTMDAAAKQTAMNNAYANINQQFQAIGHVSGADVSQYFVGAAPSTTPAAPAPVAATDPWNIESRGSDH